MSNKAPLVLLPGHLCDHRMWTHQAEALSNIANVLVLPLGARASVGELASDVLGRAPPTFALGAFSQGGFVAFEILRSPSHRVTRLAPISTAARPD
ncbi:hydrolase or acyltransferase [Cupriavidus basilensis OR16]|uniref:Hydrolase or acyltransferase n=1 Tax=Cupriavidus basilensis OR16 TaxID=1127483 RepID=H1S8N1_9BURK|nr:hypothetical protein [Cupriavidus basilensis]EHP41073.1 hydrolase or acyltransferase [Cupriavidus basilensis OR16]